MTLDELEAVAQAATPGEWRACREGECSCGMIRSIKLDAHIVTVHDEWYDQIPTIKRGERREDDEAVIEKLVYGRNGAKAQRADAKYIAAANPETILDLIAKLRAAEALYDAAATFRDATLWGGAGIDSDELTRALRAYDALGGSK